MRDRIRLYSPSVSHRSRPSHKVGRGFACCHAECSLRTWCSVVSHSLLCSIRYRRVQFFQKTPTRGASVTNVPKFPFSRKSWKRIFGERLAVTRVAEAADFPVALRVPQDRRRVGHSRNVAALVARPDRPGVEFRSCRDRLKAGDASLHVRCEPGQEGALFIGCSCSPGIRTLDRLGLGLAARSNADQERGQQSSVQFVVAVVFEVQLVVLVLFVCDAFSILGDPPRGALSEGLDAGWLRALGCDVRGWRIG